MYNDATCHKLAERVDGKFYLAYGETPVIDLETVFLDTEDFDEKKYLQVCNACTEFKMSGNGYVINLIHDDSGYDYFKCNREFYVIVSATIISANIDPVEFGRDMRKVSAYLERLQENT